MFLFKRREHEANGEIYISHVIIDKHNLDTQYPRAEVGYTANQGSFRQLYERYSIAQNIYLTCLCSALVQIMLSIPWINFALAIY